MIDIYYLDTHAIALYTILYIYILQIFVVQSIYNFLGFLYSIYIYRVINNIIYNKCKNNITIRILYVYYTYTIRILYVYYTYTIRIL